MSLNLPQPEDIRKAGTFAIRNTLADIRWWLENYPARALQSRDAHFGGKLKQALRVDLDAEDTFVRQLNVEYEGGEFKDVLVFGEESIDATTDWTNEDHIIALVDMVDGTDLVERNLSNWCSAAIFFCPAAEEGKRILAACVGFPSGRIYYADAKSDGVWCKPTDAKPRRVGGLSTVKDLRQASICFYGQKPLSLHRTVQTPLLEYLMAPAATTNDDGSPKRKNRIYTLAGIPMIVKLIDHQVKSAANIDVVFECGGQRPHDFVAGAYLAIKENAVVRNLDSGNDITLIDLEKALMKPDNPASDFRYVIASTSELCDEIFPLVTKSKN